MIKRYITLNNIKCYSTYTSLLNPLQNFNTNPKPVSDPVDNYVKLDNNINIYFEKPVFPSYMSFGILFNIGTHYENYNTKGSLLYLKYSIENYLIKNYFKVYANTTVTLNEDFLYISFNCMSSQFEEFVQVYSKILDQNILCPDTLQILSENLVDNDSDNILKLFNNAAFGDKTYGILNDSYKDNLNNIKKFKETANIFVSNIINSETISLGCSGVYNDKEFYDIVNKYFGALTIKQRNNIQNNNLLLVDDVCYKGGYSFSKVNYDNPLRIPNSVSIALGFESVPWDHDDSIVLRLAEKILGEASGFSQGGPGKGMFSRLNNLLNTMSNCMKISCFNNNYLKSGVFGIEVEGFSGYEYFYINNILKELATIANEPIDPKELERNKLMLKTELLSNLEKQNNRLEEKLKEKIMFGEIKIYKIISQIDSITSENINSALRKYFKNISISYIGESRSQLDVKEKIDSLINSARL